MKIIKHIIIFLCLFVCSFSKAADNDSITVSLLTCAPGTEVYELYGHTALRYCDETKGVDLAFNYGIFSFQTPNFIFRFVKGETDYQLGVIPFDIFLREYARRGSEVTEQVLNLNAEQKASLFLYLQKNSRIENRTYRYNFFYDNCTTRARDAFENSLGSSRIIYNNVESDSHCDKNKTFRDVIHEFNGGNLWSRMGIDLCLGADADKPIDERQRMFAPFYMLFYADHAVIKDSVGGIRPLVLEKRVYPAEARVVEADLWFSPLKAFFALLLVTLFVLLIARKWMTVLTVYEVVAFTAQAVAGVIVAFLLFFSSHPTVNSNWLIIVLNPLPIIYPFLSLMRKEKLKRYYHYANLSVMTIFLALFWAIPQQFGVEVLILATNLWIVSAGHLILTRKKS